MTAEGWGKMNWRKGSPPPYPFYPPKNELLLLLLRGKESGSGKRERKKRLDLSYFSRDDDKEIGLPGFFPLGIFYYYYEGDRRRRIALIFAFFP